MRILALGATGRIGEIFTRFAVEAGLEVTALNRRGAAGFDGRARVRVGDVTHRGVLTEAMRGQDVVVSTLGPSGMRDSTPVITKAMRGVAAAAAATGVRRVVLVSAFGVGESIDHASLQARMLYGTITRRIYRDKASAEQALVESTLPWTIVQPGGLTDRPESRYTATPLRELQRVPGLPSTSRANVARFLLSTVVDDSFVRDTVFIRDATA